LCAFGWCRLHRIVRKNNDAKVNINGRTKSQAPNMAVSNPFTCTWPYTIYSNANVWGEYVGINPHNVVQRGVFAIHSFLHGESDDLAPDNGPTATVAIVIGDESVDRSEPGFAKSQSRTIGSCSFNEIAKDRRWVQASGGHGDSGAQRGQEVGTSFVSSAQRASTDANSLR
jgi:hypothetical protein